MKLKKVVIDLEGNASTVSNDSTTMIVNETIYINAQCEDSRDENLNGNTANRYIYETFDWTTSNPEIGTKMVHLLPIKSEELKLSFVLQVTRLYQIRFLSL